MTAEKRRRLMLLRTTGAALGVLLCTAAPTVVHSMDGAVDFEPAATAAPGDGAAAPQLSIAVDDGHTSADTGATLTYTVTVRNLGTTEVTGLAVTQTMPAGLKLDSSSPAGVPGAGEVGWRTDLKATGAATFHSTMTVSKTPADLLRLATVACASTSTTGPPIVCASHSDQLPAGASAAAREAGTRSASSGGQSRWYLIGGAVLLIVAASLILWFRRRKLRQAD